MSREPDRHLTDDEAQRLAEGAGPGGDASSHAASCLSCRAAVEEYRALGAALGRLEPPPLPAGFTEGVLARIEERERRTARERRHALAVLGGIAAAAAAAFALAGASAWAPVLSSALDVVGAASRALRVGRALAPHAGVVLPEVSALAAAAAVPLLLGLGWLTAPARAGKR
jgi:hypothetical protein